jgi:hypothetical protein
MKFFNPTEFSSCTSRAMEEYGCVENEMYVVLTRVIVAERQCARAFRRRDMQDAIL